MSKLHDPFGEAIFYREQGAVSDMIVVGLRILLALVHVGLDDGVDS